MHFGEHVTIDGYGGSRELLDDQAVVQGALAHLVQALGMKPITEVQVVHVPGNGAKDPGGWSGFVMIEESHISMHTFPLRGFVSADVYTCRNGLDVDFIETYFKETFGLTDVEKNFLKRGTRYPETNLS